MLIFQGKRAMNIAKKSHVRQNFQKQKAQRSRTSEVNAFIVHERQHIELLYVCKVFSGPFLGG